MRHKKWYIGLAIGLIACTAAYAINLQGQLYAVGIEWLGDTIKFFNPVDLTDGWAIDGVTVTASAAEINAFPGTGLSAAELGVLDAVTPGTSASNKAVVLGATGKIDTIDLTAWKVGGTAISSTAIELNYNDVTTLGTSQASKAVTADASNQVLGLDCKTNFAIDNTNVTSTAAELNYCDVTTLGAAEAGKVVTTTTPGNVVTALDITTLTLNGTAVTATPAEINAVTGNVTAVQAQVNALKFVRTFTETATAGTYTATVSVPAGYTVLNMDWINSAVWNNTTSATLNVGDNDDPDGYFDAVDLKTAPAAAARLSSLPNLPGAPYGDYCGAPKAYSGAKTITATVVTVHAVGDTGRSTFIVEMVKTANAVAAASKA